MGEPARKAVPRRITFAAITVSTLALVCSTTEQRPPPEPRSVSYPVQPVAAIIESPTTVGIADSDVMRMDTIEHINQQLDLIQAMGVQNVRVGISWYASQPSEDGDFIWENTEYVIEEANRRGMGVLGVLHETPRWAGSPSLSGMPDPDAFAAFAGAVAARYEGKISALEIWNEPNGRFFLNPVNPAGYTAMLQAAYTAIKAQDDPTDPTDDITVVAGVLGAGRTMGDLTMNPVDYLEGMYAAGAHGYFDAFSFHPYQYDIMFSRGESQADSPILQLRAIRDLMHANGDGDLKVWASEYGLPTAPPSLLFPFIYNSPQKQARFIEDFLYNWQNEEGTGPIFIYSTQDLNSGSFSAEKNFGLFYSNGRPKPAVQVIIDFLNGEGPSTPPANLIAEIVGGIVLSAGVTIKHAVDAVARVVRVLVRAAVGVIGAIATAVMNVVCGIIDGITHSLGVRNSAPAQDDTTSAATVAAFEESSVADSAPTDHEDPATRGVTEAAEPTNATEPTLSRLDTDETVTEDAAPERVQSDSGELESTEPEVTEPDPTEPEDLTTADPEDTEEDTSVEPDTATDPDADTDPADTAPESSAAMSGAAAKGRSVTQAQPGHRKSLDFGDVHRLSSGPLRSAGMGVGVINPADTRPVFPSG